MTNEPSSDDMQRWTAERKAAVVLDLPAGKTTSAAEVARSHGLTLSEVEQWKADFIAQAPSPCGPIPVTWLPSRRLVNSNSWPTVRPKNSPSLPSCANSSSSPTAS